MHTSCENKRSSTYTGGLGMNSRTEMSCILKLLKLIIWRKKQKLVQRNSTRSHDTTVQRNKIIPFQLFTFFAEKEAWMLQLISED